MITPHEGTSGEENKQELDHNQWPDANDVVNTLYTLNDELEDANDIEADPDEYMTPPITMESDGIECWVMFMNETIWFSGEDERPILNEDTEERMDLTRYLKNQVSLRIRRLSKLARLAGWYSEFKPLAE